MILKTLDDLEQSPHLLLMRCISGSRAYGLHTPQSDTDIKGVFMMPKTQFYGLQPVDQLHNESNDIVYFELGRFVELLLKNNPNILELLYIPEDCILYRHPLMDLIKPELFLSKLCQQTFAGYAFSQIKKAKGLHKKIVNPVPIEKKSILEFCYVVQGQSAVALPRWLTQNGFNAGDCGLVNLPHLRDMYALYHTDQGNGFPVRGIISAEGVDDVCVSSIPKGVEPMAYMGFHKDGYASYCREYREYWAWVALRNDDRYRNTMAHGKNYDAKNMMHTFRLLTVAEEIATHHKVHVRRTHDRDLLLKIKMGEMAYEDLYQQALEKIAHIEELFQHCDLPEAPDPVQIENLLCELRERLYG